MAKSRAFISFDFDNDDTWRNLFVGQGKNPDTPWEIDDWSSKEVLAQSKWEEIIRDKINRCHMVIVLVGRHMGSASGVVKEITMAKSQDVPLFGVYVDDANSSSTLPEGLARSRTITWTWDNVAKMVDQMMKEGKNAQKRASWW
jgi:MTH538 TIR-like domain (DUF1863)